jgi:hypothetical protein
VSGIVQASVIEFQLSPCFYIDASLPVVNPSVGGKRLGNRDLSPQWRRLNLSVVISEPLRNSTGSW